MTFLYVLVRLSSWCSDKESACKCRRYRRLRFDPWVGTTSWSRKWQPTPGFLPGKFHRQRSLVGYSPWGRKESDVTEWLSTYTHVCVSVVQTCPTLCDPTDCSPPVSTVHGILQARILEWVAIPFSRGSSWPRNRTQVSRTAGRFLTIWASRKAHICHSSLDKQKQLQIVQLNDWSICQ